MESSWASFLSPNSSRSSSSDTSNVARTPAAPERVVLVDVDPQAQTISNGAVTRKVTISTVWSGLFFSCKTLKLRFLKKNLNAFLIQAVYYGVRTSLSEL